MRLARLPLALLAPALLAAGALTSDGDQGGGPPDESRFTKKVLVEGLDEPFQIEFDGRGRVYWIERSSANVKRLDESTGQVTLLGKIPATVVAEGGLAGILLDRDFDRTGWIYFYYTHVAGSNREGRLSRFTLARDSALDLASEAVLLRWPIDTDGHIGGGMTWDAAGNLYLSVGDNSAPSQYGAFRFTEPGGAGEDVFRTSGNANDLRGKILRIRPQPDGRYTIPPGNLFPPGTPNTRPEIYTMGNRNPWRLHVDSRTGFLHWGEIGPDAGKDSVGVGPMGYDEFNVARAPGNFGWPWTIGYNRPYHRYDYASNRDAEPLDLARPVNPSPNNTGPRELPAAQRPLVAYPYGGSEEYPLLGSGGRAAIGGPVFHRADFRPDAKRVFPAYYEGKWLVTDYVRNWIVALTLDAGSTRVLGAERFFPSGRYLNPIDIAFGPDGDLYVVEYARAPYGRISKVEYNGGNRAPRVSVSADRTAGAAPLRVSLSSTGTVDHDGDALRYEWVVTPEGQLAPQRFATANPTVTLTRPGAYRVTLTATDPSGAAGTAELRVVAGNEPPLLTVRASRGNRSFYFPGTDLQYEVRVSDREDGPVPADSVRVTGEFIPAGLTPAQAEEARALAPGASARHLQAFAILARSDCRGCHTEDARLVGPAFREVSQRYRDQPDAAEHLAQKIVAGGSGSWGTTAMPPHPTLTPVEATALARYVLGVGAPDAAPQRLPLAGTFATPTPPGRQDPVRVIQLGSYLLRASYTDRGANGVAPITTSEAILLRQPRLAPEDADFISEGTMFAPTLGDPSFVINRSGAHIGYRAIDLTGVDSIAVGTLTRFYTWSHFIGGTVEVHLDSPTGPMLGAPKRVTPPAPRAREQPAQSAAGQAAPVVANPGAAMVFGDDLDRPVTFPVGGIAGMRDVYVVFRNPDAGPAASLFLVTGVEFRPVR